FTYLEVPFGPVQSFPIVEATPPAPAIRVDKPLMPEVKDDLEKAPATTPSLGLLESVRQRSRAWPMRALVLTVTAVVLAFAGVNYWQSSRFPSQGLPSTSLELHVQQQPGSLTLTWNPSSRDL